MDEVIEVTTDYILGDAKAREMAISIYEAMPKVRDRLIGQIWQDVWEHVRKDLRETVKEEFWDKKNPYNGFWFWKDGSLVCLSAETRVVGQKGVEGPVFGVCRFPQNRSELDDGRLKELVRCFNEVTKGMGEPMDMKRFGSYYGHDRYYAVQVNVGRSSPKASGGPRGRVPSMWHGELVLPQVVRNHKEIADALAELLLETYNGVKELL